MSHRGLLRGLLLLLLASWLIHWLIAGRYAMLDDCFIHLRYAGFLLKTHTITYDGLHPSFGTSSPLYVVLLALLRPIFPGPLLPKGLSTFAYLLIVLVMVVQCLRARASTTARALLFMLTFCLVCPMGIRWLTDGMETPLHLLFTLALAFIADREVNTDHISPSRAIGLFAFGFLMTTLRIESASLLFLASLAIVASRIRAMPSNRAAAALRAIPLALGAVAALATIRITLGHVLPDTALAKSSSPSLKPLLESALLLLHSLNLGVGLLLLWAVSLALLWRTRSSSPTRLTLPVLLTANAIFPLTVALACLRGQFVQGIRYLLWCIVFSTLWNILQIARIPTEPSLFGQPSNAPPLFRIPVTLAALSLLLFALLPLEIHFVRPTLRDRGAVFTALRCTPLHLLQNQRIMSADVGYIGYFSGAPICDVEGLVDGRAFASLTKAQRIRTCATSSPAVLFLNDFQLHEAAGFLNLNLWSVCRTYDFAGVATRDRHYLMVPTTAASTECSSLGGQPTPYTSLTNFAP